MPKFIKTTLLGGVVFLVPVVVFLVIVGKAVAAIRTLTHPLAALLPFPPVLGALVANLLSLLVLLLVCFLAGMAARTSVARGVIASLERNVLDNVPGYALIKARSQGLIAAQEAGSPMQPVLVRFDDLWQLALQVERAPPDRVVVFLPGAPDPWSGSVCVVEADRVTAVDVTLNEFAAMIRRAGAGTGEFVAARS